MRRRISSLTVSALGDRMIAQLRTMENGFTKMTAAMPAADVDPEARERLAALGYVGTFVASASDPRTGRADPKDKIGLFNKLNDATDLSKDRDEDAGRDRSAASSACSPRSSRRILRSSMPGSCGARSISRTAIWRRRLPTSSRRSC